MFQASDSKGIYALFRQRSVRPSAPTGGARANKNNPGAQKSKRCAGEDEQDVGEQISHTSPIPERLRSGAWLGFITVLSARDIGLAKAVKRSGWPSAACASHKPDQPAWSADLLGRDVSLPASPVTRRHCALGPSQRGSGIWDRDCHESRRRQQHESRMPAIGEGFWWLLSPQ